MSSNKLIKLKSWCDTLWESGPLGEVGTGMIKILKGKIGEAYSEGRKAAQRERKVRAHRGIQRKRVSQLQSR